MLVTTDGVVFSFNGVMLRQIDGAANGQPFRSSFGKYLWVFMTIGFENCINRYVDDAFELFSDEQEAVIYFDQIESLYPSLRFSMAKENDC